MNIHKKRYEIPEGTLRKGIYFIVLYSVVFPHQTKFCFFDIVPSRGNIEWEINKIRGKINPLFIFS